MKRILVLVTICLFAAIAWSQQPSPARQKMVWAHYVCWGFNHVEGFDQATTSNGVWALCPFNSRTLSGRNIQWNSGIFSGNRKQMEEAKFWGIDGFCIDVTDPAAYVWIMSRFFRDAEGMDFKIALCIDNLRSDTEAAIRHLGDFVRTYQNHPNACRIDGKMVIFSYWLGEQSPEQFEYIRNELKKQGLDAYYLLQPMHETSCWDNPKLLAKMAEISDGFYDFGCNGLAEEDIIQRLANGRDALDKHNPSGILCAGIAQGYVGHGNACYRPFLNTGSFRQNWNSAMVNHADWVCLTTWNDYGEHTNFEPNAVDRTALVRLNREYIAKWKNEEKFPRPPQVVATYQEEILAGDDLTLELFSGYYTTEPAQVCLRLLDKEGNVFRELPPFELSQDDISIMTYRLKPNELGQLNALRVQLAIGTPDQEKKWKELYPILRRPDRKASVRTIRQASADLGFENIALAVDKGTIYFQYNGFTFAGKLEILRNGWPVYEQEINHLDTPAYTAEIPVPQRAVSPEEWYIARVIDGAGRVTYSAPFFYVTTDIPGTSRQPVIFTDCDFDEGWPIWSEKDTKANPRVEWMTIPNRDIFALHFDFAQQADYFFSDSGWGYGAMAGRVPGYDYWSKPEFRPQWIEGEGPDGAKRLLPHFNGKNNITIAPRCFPAGPFTLQFIFRPENGSGVLFEVAGVRLETNADNHIVFTHSPESHSTATLVSDSAVHLNQWNTLTATYTGEALRLKLNGKSAGEIADSPCSFGLNAIPVIGNDFWGQHGFIGELADVSLQGGVIE